MSTLRARRLLEAPVLPTLLWLAAPGALLVLTQSAVSISDTYFVGRLGTEALAGLALVFPLVMLLQMISAGAMGGGISSAVARALGAGHEARARQLVVHAMVIALVLGVAFTVFLLALGRPIYALLGGSGAVIRNALDYSDVLFCGAVLVWIANTFASILRGSGNTLVPALALIGAAFVHVPLSFGLVLGAGPMPRLGIAGAGLAYIIAAGCAAAVTGTYIWNSPLRPARSELRLDPRLFREILRVGLISSVSSVQTVLAAVIVTGLVGRFGAAALAGYGVGIRLELLQVPLVFSVGQALVVLVGTHVGAGQGARAKRIAWTGAGLAATVSAVIGFGAALFPAAWVTLFSADPAVIEAGSQYLRIVGPFYPLFGVNIALYFASQGRGRVAWPVFAGTLRLAIVVAGGLASVSLGAPLWTVFVVLAAGILVMGSVTAWAVHRSDWGG
jgi:putative MATE family efflux protein